MGLKCFLKFKTRNIALTTKAVKKYKIKFFLKFKKREIKN